MSKGLERAADAVRHGKALADIIKALKIAGLKGAAVAATKHYWPYILGAAAVLILMPFIILASLPAILFGFGSDTPEAIRGEQLRAYYRRYDEFRNEQLEEKRSAFEQESDNVTYEIEFVNGSFDIYWFIALHSVHHRNDQGTMNEQNVREFVRKTYTYEIICVDPDDEDAEDEAAQDEDPDTSNGGKRTLKVTTLSAHDVKQGLGFDDEKTMWATLIYETYSSYQSGPETN